MIEALALFGLAVRPECRRFRNTPREVDLVDELAEGLVEGAAALSESGVRR